MAGDAADGEVRFVPALARSNHNALKHLHTFARAFDDPHMNLYRVAGFNLRMFVIVGDQGPNQFLANGCVPSTKIRPKAHAIVWNSEHSSMDSRHVSRVFAHEIQATSSGHGRRKFGIANEPPLRRLQHLARIQAINVSDIVERSQHIDGGAQADGDAIQGIILPYRVGAGLR